jgi:hypothetical protein
MLDGLGCMLTEPTFITAIYTHDMLLVVSCEDKLVLYGKNEALSVSPNNTAVRIHSVERTESVL